MFHWEALRGVLSVATKRSLLLYRYDDARGDFSGAVRDLPVPESVKCIAWCGDALCLGFRREYVMLNIASGAMSEVFPTGRAGAPSALPLPPGELLLTRDAVGVFVGRDGKATRRGGLPWSEPPLALAHAPPFALALLPRGLELRSAARGGGGGGGVAGGGSAAPSPAGSSAAAPPAAPLAAQHAAAAVQAVPLPPGAHALVAAPGGWFAAVCRDALVVLRPVPLSAQVRELAARGALDAALSLCDALDDAAADAADALGEEEEEGGDADGVRAPAVAAAAAAAAALRADVHGRYGYKLFAEGAYADALAHFRASAVSPLEVLALFPGLLPHGHAAAAAAAAAGRREPPGGVRLAAAQAALLPYLTAMRESAWRAARARRLAGNAAAAASSSASTAAPSAPVGLAAPSDDDLRCLDTATLAVMVASGGEQDALLRLLILPNAVDLATGERVLADAGRNAEMVALYRSHGLHRRALELLARLGRAAAASSGDASSAAEDGGSPSAAQSGAAAAAASPFGPKAVVEYLLALKPQDPALLFEFSIGVLAASPRDGLALFTRASPPLPPAAVLPHLRAHAPALCAPYLAHELAVRGAATPTEYHNALVLLHHEEVSRERAAAGAAWQESSRSAARAALLATLADPRVRYAPERLLCRFPARAQLAERAALLRRLRRHADALAIYVHALRDPAAAEAYADDVWREATARAAAASAAASGGGDDDGGGGGADDAAAGAAAAAAAGADAAAAGAGAGGEAPEGEAPERDVYLSLLTVYLRGSASLRSGDETDGDDDYMDARARALGAGGPQQQQAQQAQPGSAALEAALSLLTRRAGRIDGARALALLPDGVSLAALLPFFEGALRSAREARRSSAVTAALRRREHFTARDALTAQRDRCVTLAADAPCAVCPGRIGGAVFAVSPSGRVAHYTCFLSATGGVAQPPDGRRTAGWG
jgi:hypothetical protein